MRHIQCQCGHLQGVVSPNAGVTRLLCHCQDCQAYAHALEQAERMLNPQGGTDVVTTLQQHVSFTSGAESLACVSLSDKGMLRWYASCCNTPIANTARDPKLSFVSLVHNCLDDLDHEFSPKYVAVNTKHAKGKVNASAISGLFATARIISSVVGAQLNGSWKKSPFFRPGTLKPVATPRVLHAAEREQAYQAAKS
ncbi:DUF6151 family protein [Undibacterium terreum]|uniref:CENP-V/GFA domain-containing protein n=1 Tax=Undibacterium terreum TaxID=1224302 RepID=A0A916UBL6_9BURK|nr:DUF6151 family protein [Undibacterium terreum]GGC65064.1 hypothetical protein GCM10011396_10090 [Undibacterium terreum]